jgi:protein-arginine kinase activator protein McsA
LKSSETLGTSKDLSSLSLESLQKMLDLAIERENYELAAQVRDEMNQRSIT